MLIKTKIKDEDYENVDFEYSLSPGFLKEIISLFLFVWAMVITLKIFGVIPISVTTLLLFPVVMISILILLAIAFDYILAVMFTKLRKDRTNDT